MFTGAVVSRQATLGCGRVNADALSWRALSLFERGAAALLVAGLAPFAVLVGFAIWILSGQSPLIAVLRIGRHNAPLWLLKFRTLWAQEQTPHPQFRILEHVVDEDGPLRKEVVDARVSSHFARFCRRFSIDELPQLIHVVRGEMSLVGPRPLTRSELCEYYGDDAEEVLSVRPGITGLWQVGGRSALTYPERRSLDLKLVRSFTLRVYLLTLLRTIPAVFRGANSW